MLNVVRYIVVVFGNKFAFKGTWVSNIHEIPSVANVNQYCQLKRVPMHLLNFIKLLKNVIFGKIYNKQDQCLWKGLERNFILFLLELSHIIMENKFLQLKLSIL